MTEIAKNAVTAAAWKMGADIETLEDGTQVLHVEYDGNTCRCGCQQGVNGDSNFRQGHDMKLVSKLLLAARNDLTVQVTAGGMATSGSAEAMARHFGGAFPQKLANRAAKRTKVGPKERKAIKQAEKEAREAAAQEQEPVAIRAKVGRWEYDGYRDSDGSFYYTNKQDKVVTVPEGKFKVIEIR